jgi:2'-hydroxyisoflavone reductase
VAACDIEPWTELPVWLPPDDEYSWLHDMSVERAHATGLECRPIEETVADTWEWLVSTGKDPPLSENAAPGLDAEKERAALAAWASARQSVPRRG